MFRFTITYRALYQSRRKPQNIVVSRDSSRHCDACLSLERGHIIDGFISSCILFFPAITDTSLIVLSHLTTEMDSLPWNEIIGVGRDDDRATHCSRKLNEWLNRRICSLERISVGKPKCVELEHLSKSQYTPAIAQQDCIMTQIFLHFILSNIGLLK